MFHAQQCIRINFGPMRRELMSNSPSDWSKWDLIKGAHNSGLTFVMRYAALKAFL